MTNIQVRRNFALSAELVNTAVEALLDRIHPVQDPTIGFVKDCLAGAVLVASFASLLVFILFLTTLI